MRARFRPIGAILIALAAICLQRAATLAWAVATDPAGGRYEVSTIGVIRSTVPAATPETCRWWPKMGAAELCVEADDGATPFRRLRMAYPLLATAMWVAVIALFLQVLRLPRPPLVRSAVTWCSTALAIAAITAMCLALPDALASLTGRSLRWGGTGFAFACAASVSSLLSGVLALSPGPERPAVAAG